MGPGVDMFPCRMLLCMFPGSSVTSHIAVAKETCPSGSLFLESKEGKQVFLLQFMPNVTFMPRLLKRQAPLSGAGIH